MRSRTHRSKIFCSCPAKTHQSIRRSRCRRSLGNSADARSAEMTTEPKASSSQKPTDEHPTSDQPLGNVTPNRIVVVGTTGSGKTTTARRIGEIIGAPHVELDALHWEADWTEADTETFRRRIVEATAGERWVVDGNYAKGRDLVWPRAEMIVWLDY